MRKCILVQFPPKEKSEDKGQELCITLQRLVVSLGYRAEISITGTNRATVCVCGTALNVSPEGFPKGPKEMMFFSTLKKESPVCN